jgi:hypothetical protein
MNEVLWILSNPQGVTVPQLESNVDLHLLISVSVYRSILVLFLSPLVFPVYSILNFFFPLICGLWIRLISSLWVHKLIDPQFYT